jgi:hypothetical protein
MSKRGGTSGGRLGIVLCALGALGPSCATPKKAAEAPIKAASETELAARFLQTPLENHRCKAAVYPHAKNSWKIARVVAVAGRGPSFVTALEALCRETDGLKLPAVVDIYYSRAPSGWSPNHEIRGTAIRYEDGFVPPHAPKLSDIKQPELPKNGDDEPAPQGEGQKS